MNKFLIPVIASILLLGTIGTSFDANAASDNKQKVRIDTIGGIVSNFDYFYEVSAKSAMTNAGNNGGLQLFTSVTVTDLDGNPLTSFEGISPLVQRPNYEPDEDGFVKLVTYGIPFVYDGPSYCDDGIVTVHSSLITAGGKVLPLGDSSTEQRWISASGGCGV